MMHHSEIVNMRVSWHSGTDSLDMSPRLTLPTPNPNPNPNEVTHIVNPSSIPGSTLTHRSSPKPNPNISLTLTLLIKIVITLTLTLILTLTRALTSASALLGPMAKVCFQEDPIPTPRPTFHPKWDLGP